MDEEGALTSKAVLFDQHYPGADTSVDILKGHDRHFVSHSRKVCEEYGFCFYFADFFKSIAKCAYEYDDIEEIERQTLLTSVVELNGTPVAKNGYFDESIFVQDSPFKACRTDDNDSDALEKTRIYSYKMGVSTALSNTSYDTDYQQVVVILPRAFRMELLQAPRVREESSVLSNEPLPKCEVIECMDNLKAELLRNPEYCESRQDLHVLYNVIVREMKTWSSR